MKVDRTIAGGNVAASAYAKRAAAAQAPRALPPPGGSASVLGIPEEEFTPRVRDAIMGLLAEVDQLRRELQDAKTRIEDAERTADQDHLVPLLNRRAFVRELTRAIAFSDRYGTASSLVYFDLDGFKAINDAHGHAGGDAVLTHFAQTLHANVRDSDVVGRLGGDEFGVILSHASQEQAHKKASSLAERLRASPAQWRGISIPMTFSFGVFELRPGESADSAMARADEAMYARKRAR